MLRLRLGRSIKTQFFLAPGELVLLNGVKLGSIIVRTRGQNALELASQLSKALNFLLRPFLLSSELEQGCASEHVCGAGRIGDARQLQHELVITNGLQRGFSNTETVDAAIEHSLHRFHLLGADGGDFSGRLDFERELTAPAQIKSKLEREARQNCSCRDGKRKDEGEPALLTGHQSKPLTNDGLSRFDNLMRLNDGQILEIAVVGGRDVLAGQPDRPGIELIEAVLCDQSN